MDTTTTKLSVLKANVKRYGWMRSLYKTVVWFAARYLGIHVYLVRIRPMEGNPGYPYTLPDIAFRRISSDELMKAGDDSKLGLGHGFVQAAIERGDLAFGAFDGSRLVSYVWRASTSAPHEDGIWVRVNRPYNYSYKSYTKPSYRGRHLCPATILFSDAYMYQQGYTHRVGFVAVSNFSSLAAGKYMESEPIGHAGYFDWFGRRFSFATKAVKSIGFEFFVPERGS